MEDQNKVKSAAPPHDPRLWVGYDKFNHVQAILDQNRILINEIKQNHESRDADGLMRNCNLIRELNSNMAKVVKIYGEISHTFVKTFGRRRDS